jgi:hypothetical protein
VEVELTWVDGSIDRRSWDSGTRWVKWTIDSSQRLDQLVIDPDGVWALETQRADNYWRDDPVRTDHPLWWVRRSVAFVSRIFLRLL